MSNYRNPQSIQPPPSPVMHVSVLIFVFSNAAALTSLSLHQDKHLLSSFIKKPSS